MGLELNGDNYLPTREHIKKYAMLCSLCGLRLWKMAWRLTYHFYLRGEEKKGGGCGRPGGVKKMFKESRILLLMMQFGF
jgi:hypothetical protein